MGWRAVFRILTDPTARPGERTAFVVVVQILHHRGHGLGGGPSGLHLRNPGIEHLGRAAPSDRATGSPRIRNTARHT